ncbi:MAG: hypothetical protein PHQ98_01795 [Candidatus ainarchaeum sp.]|nr:hypothetical protein [Candidatus ainarchaeum sp.]
MNWKKLINIFLVATILLIVAMNVSAACWIDFYDAQAYVRTQNGSYSNEINASSGDYIDIKLELDVRDYSGDCSSQLNSYSKIYRWNGSDWSYVSQTSSNYQYLSNRFITQTWSRAFSVSNNYSEYKIISYIQSNYGTVQELTSYVNVSSSGNCSGITISTSDFTMNSNSTSSKTFRIINNTNKRFEINKVDVTTYNSLINTINSYYSGNTIYSNSSKDVEVKVSTNYTSSDKSLSATFAVQGYLDGKYCSFYEIGQKTFSIAVRSNSGPYYDSECSNITISGSDFTVDSGNTQKETFYIKNNSSKRFEITGVDLTSNGIDLKSSYYSQYAYPYESSNFVIEAKAPHTSDTRNYENTVRIKGRFSDGKTCEYNAIKEKTFKVYLNSNEVQTNCNSFVLTAPSVLNIENFGTIPLTITNGTNKRADIYVESNLDVSPTVISLPENSSLSRSVSVALAYSSGEVSFRPVVEGCVYQPTRVNIYNNATGNLSSVSIKTSVITDNGVTKLRVEFNNPASKMFIGTLKLNATGWSTDDKPLTITSGTNTVEMVLNKMSNPSNTGSVIFSSNGQEIKTDFSVNNNGSDSLVGLFGLFGTFGWIAVILLVIVVAIVILNKEPKRPQENWQK